MTANKVWNLGLLFLAVFACKTSDAGESEVGSLGERIQRIRRGNSESGLTVRRLLPVNIERHPKLSPLSSMHANHFNTGSTDLLAPRVGAIKMKNIRFGRVPGLNRLGMNMCLNFMHDFDGNLYGFCTSPIAGYLGGIDFHLTLFDPNTLEKLDRYSFFRGELPRLIRNDLPLNLGYFVMDNEGRIIVTTADGEILFLKKSQHQNKIELVKQIDLPEPMKALGQLSQVIPDYEGNYWFFMPGKRGAESAQIGFIEKNTEEIEIHELAGEVIENGMAIDSTGLFVVSDFALYKFKRTDGRIVISFKETYERSDTVKPGTISIEGSGTVPTLHERDLVTIVDNANDQVNLLVFDRTDNPPESGRQICKVPLFTTGESSVENSVVIHHNSIIVQNWHNAPTFVASIKDMYPGVWRIDVREDRSGCDIIWKNDTSFGAGTIKLSTETGILYLGTQNRKGLLREKSYVELLDFRTGLLLKSVYIGRGLGSRLLMAPVFIIPGGKLIQPTFNGIAVLEN